MCSPLDSGWRNGFGKVDSATSRLAPLLIQKQYPFSENAAELVPFGNAVAEAACDPDTGDCKGRLRFEAPDSATGMPRCETIITLA